MRLVIFAALLVVVPGCVVQTPSTADTECGNGFYPIFMKVQREDAPSADLFALDRNRDLVVVRGTFKENGTGQATLTKNATLKGITATDVPLELKRAGFLPADRNVSVKVAWKSKISVDEFNELCERTDGEFFSLEPKYESGSCKDCPAVQITANTQRGEQTTRVEGSDAPAPFLEVQTFFHNVTEAHRIAVGAPV